jgi:uncharacterized protein (TIGR03437 family)
LAEPSGDQLPIKIVNAGAQIMFGGTAARLSFVSPQQINFLVPASRSAGNTTLAVVRDGLFGPTIPVTVADVAPGLFQNAGLAAASHADGTLVTPGSPAQAGEIVVLYGSGLGKTAIPLDFQDEGRLVPLTADLNAIRIARFQELSVTVNDTPLDTSQIFWAGLTPGLAGVYQVNLKLPDVIDANPEIRLFVGDQASPPGVKLATH